MITRFHTRVAAGFLVCAVSMVFACSDSGIDAPEQLGPEQLDGASYGLGVSEPLPVQSFAMARVAGGPATAGSDHEVAYVFLSRGRFRPFETATITNLMSGASRTEPLVDGGFDPVPISAAAGDTLEIAILGISAPLFRLVSEVPVRAPPRVVRIEPGPGKVDVVFKVAAFVIFSEPVDEQTVTPETIKLLLDGQPVDGTLILSPDGLRATFTPAARLAPETTYTLVIATGIQDLAGDSLEEEVVVSFTTGLAVASATITASEVAVAVDGKIQLLTRLKDAAGNILVGREVSWFSSDERIAAVDTNGLLVGIALGSAMITATSEGQSGTATVRVGVPGRFIQISAGSWDLHTCGVTTNSEAYCWGHAVDGQLGIGPSVPGDQLRPAPVQGGLRFTTVSAGGLHTCGVATSGEPYCWGWNLLGQLGDFDQTGSSKFVPVRVALQNVLQDLSAGGNHTCGISTSGQAYCWGADYSGEVGDGDETYFGHGSAGVFGGLDFATVSAGSSHTCAISTSAEAYCWGAGGFGALGNGSKDMMTAPSLVAGGFTFGSVSSGGWHACGITTSGETYCWGSNESGQLGTEAATEICDRREGTSNVRLSEPCATRPVRFSGGLTLAHVSAGGRHTCGITTDGEAYCWGNNEFGQLGNGSTSNSVAPVPISGGLRFESVSAGWEYTCGVTDDGIAYCWGDNGHGQLGDGSFIGSSVPVRVADQPE